MVMDVQPDYQFQHRHIFGIDQLSVQDIWHILATARSFREISSRPIKKVPTLRGKTVINLFFEPSTRTRLSFEIAAKRMSADTYNISASSSSAVKGETLIDTARKVAIIGDITHSRVAHSDIIGFTKMGARVMVSGPATLLPFGIEQLGATVCHSVAEAVADADVVMALRIQ